MKTVKIGETKYIRDVNSKAILSTNRNALENYKMARLKKQEENNVINTMKQDIKELKEMIQTLIGKQNG
jgi:hypothetical protein